MFDRFQDCGVRGRGDGVGVFDAGDFVGGFGDTACINGRMQIVYVRVGKVGMGVVVARYCDCAIGGVFGQVRFQLCRGMAGVYVVFLEGFGGGERETGPDDAGWGEGGDEEG